MPSIDPRSLRRLPETNIPNGAGFSSAFYHMVDKFAAILGLFLVGTTAR